METILNSDEYEDLRAFYEYSEEDGLPRITSFRPKTVIRCCELLKALIQDEVLWHSYQNPAAPLFAIRIRNTICSNVWKGVILVHRRHLQTFFNFFKKEYVKIFTFPKSGNKVKIVVVKKKKKPRGRSIDDLRPPLPGLEIIRPSRSTEDIASHSAARNTEITTAEEVIEWLPTSSLTNTQILPQTRVELPEAVVELTSIAPPVIETEETSLRPARELIEIDPLQAPLGRNENLGTAMDVEPSNAESSNLERQIQNLNLIEVLEEGMTEPGQRDIGSTKETSDILRSEKGTGKSSEVVDTIDEIRQFLQESGLGIEGHEHIKSMDQLQQVLEMELFRSSPQLPSNLIPQRSSSSEDLPRLFQVQAEIHSLPPEVRSREQSAEPNATSREQIPARTPPRETQVEVHIPPECADIGRIETAARTEPTDIHRVQIEAHPLQKDTNFGGDELVDTRGIPMADQEFWDQLNTDAGAEKRAVDEQRDVGISHLANRPLDIFDEIDRIERDSILQQANAGNFIQPLQASTPENITELKKPSEIDKDRATVASEIQTVADMLIQGLERQLPSERDIVEIRSPSQSMGGIQNINGQRSPSLQPMQPIPQSITRVLQRPDVASERAETRSSPLARPLPRIRDLLEQDLSLVRAPTRRVRKKKIMYSQAVLAKKMAKIIKPKNYVSHASRVHEWAESNRRICLQFIPLNYDEPIHNAMNYVDYFREPFEEWPQDYNGFTRLICDLFENNVDEEGAEETLRTDLRASVAAPDRLRSILRLSHRRSLGIDEPTKKSFLPEDQERRSSLREMQPPPNIPRIGDISLNVPNLSDMLVEKSLVEPESIAIQQPIQALTLPPTLTGATTRARTSAVESVVRELNETIEVVGLQRRLNGEKIVTVPVSQAEEEQRASILPQNGLAIAGIQPQVIQQEEEPRQVELPVNGLAVTNVQPQVIQVEEEEEEIQVPVRKRVSVEDVVNKLATLWSENPEEVKFTDLCPIGVTNRFVAASTFTILLNLHGRKAVTLDQEQGNSSPESLTINLPSFFR